MPVSDSIRQAIPVDLSIAGLALLLAILIGGSAGIAAALSNGGVIDRSVTVVCSIVAAMPAFVIGMLLIIIFAVKLEGAAVGRLRPVQARTRRSGCASRSCPPSR